MPLPEPTDRALTYAQVADIARTYKGEAPHWEVAKRAVPIVSDEVAIEWIRGAQERGYDVGKPRDEKSNRSARR